LKIHEYQAHEVLAGFGVPVPKGSLPRASRRSCRRPGSSPGCLGRQGAGPRRGRGKAGGVRLCRGIAELRSAAEGSPGHAPGEPSDGPGGPRGEKGAGHRGLQHCRAILRGNRPRPRPGLAGPHGFRRGRGGDRGRCRPEPEKIFKEPFSPVAGLHLHQGRSWPGDWVSRARS